jgi:hypothetical protein
MRAPVFRLRIVRIGASMSVILGGAVRFSNAIEFLEKGTNFISCQT